MCADLSPCGRQGILHLTSDFLHDVSDVARFGIPTVLLFVEHLELAMTGFDKLAGQAMRQDTRSAVEQAARGQNGGGLAWLGASEGATRASPAPKLRPE